MLSIRSKLTLAFSLFLVVLILQFALVYYFSNKSALLINEAITAHEQSSALTRVAIEGQKLRRFEKEFFIYADNPERRAKYSREWNDSYGQLKRELGVLISYQGGWSEEDKQKAQLWDDALNAYASGFNKVDVAVNGGIIQGTLAANKAIQDAKNRFKVLLTGTAVEIENKLTQARDYSSQVQSDFANIQKFLIALSLVGLLVGGFVLLTIPRAIARPISELTDAVIDISKGNISRPVSVRGGQEVKGLAESVERLRVALKGVMTRMQKLQQERSQQRSVSPGRKPREVA